MSSAEAPSVMAYERERVELLKQAAMRSLAFGIDESNDDIREAIRYFDENAERMRSESFQAAPTNQPPASSPFKREGNKLVYEMRFTEEDVRVEPMLRLTIEMPAYANGTDKPSKEGEEPVNINERKVELKAVDVAGLTHVVMKLDKIDFDKDQEKFYEAMCRRLARMLGVKKVSQKFLNEVVESANDMIVPQKKTGSDSSDSASSTETLSQDGSSETKPL